MPKQEYMMLAHKHRKENLIGWYMSEKLEGMRAFWDGGQSRGDFKSDVPYANHTEHRDHISTGLWSRYGNVIHAPQDWIDELPLGVMLDGELFSYSIDFQELRSICGRHTPDDRWDDVEYHIFDLVPPDVMFKTRQIDVPVAKFEVRGYDPRMLFSTIHDTTLPFSWSHKYLKRFTNEIVVPVRQDKVESEDQITEALAAVLGRDGEGLMFRSATSFWKTERTRELLKMKGLDEGKGICIGYYWGEETDKGSKLLGMMGAMKVQFGNVRFKLSGFTNEEREMHDPDTGSPGKPVVGTTAKMFPIGCEIEFHHRGVTNDGKPVEARYLRRSK